MARQVTTTRGSWGVSTTSGYGIEGCILNVYRCIDGPTFRDGQLRILNGQLDGLPFATSDDATALALTYGYLQLYSRNSCRFVMSRAARRRGWTTNDYRYLARREEHECVPAGWRSL